jgi:hypothetical protein
VRKLDDVNWLVLELTKHTKAVCRKGFVIGINKENEDPAG